MEMMKGKQTIALLALSILLLSLGACDRRGSLRKAREEAEQTKAELESIKVVLERTRAERDELNAEVADLSERWERTRAELAGLRQAYQIMETRYADTVNAQNAAVNRSQDAQTTVEGLRNQLRQKNEEIRELQEWIKELQAALGELESQPAPEPPAPEPAEPNEESSEDVNEVADENSTE
jgi:chromosome segregation ATPase